MSGQRTASANNLIALLEQSFPGVRKLFDSPPRADGHQKWVDFVSAYPHADRVRGVSLKKFTKSYQKWCKSRKYNFSEEKAAEIHAAGEHGDGGHNDVVDQGRADFARKAVALGTAAGSGDRDGE